MSSPQAVTRAKKVKLPKALQRTEHDEQKELFAWASLDAERVTRLRKALSDAALVCRGDAADETRSIAYRVARERSANDFTALASALPALLEASRDRDQAIKNVNLLMDAGRHQAEELSGSISERETLTAQNEELLNQRADLQQGDAVLSILS